MPLVRDADRGLLSAAGLLPQGTPEPAASTSHAGLCPPQQGTIAQCQQPLGSSGLADLL